MPINFKPDMEASWRPLAFHMKASAPGIANGHVVIFASTQIIGHDVDIMNDLVHNVGKFAGTVTNEMIKREISGIAHLHQFITENFNL